MNGRPVPWVSVVVAFALAAVSCTSGGSAASMPSGRADGDASGSQEQVAISTGGGDVWAWDEHVDGTSRCSQVHIDLDGVEVAGPVTVSGGRFSASVSLPPGPHEVTASCDREGSIVTSAPVALRERLAERPTALIALSVHAGTIDLDGTGSEPSHDAAPVTRWEWSVSASNPAPLVQRTLSGPRPFADVVVEAPRIRVDAPSRDGEYYVTLRVVDAAGRSDRSTTYFVVREGTPHAVDMDRDRPAWIGKAIVYGVIPPLFGDDPDCDPFCAVTRRLPYLEDLGVNAIWLSPVNATPPGDFGYAVTDYFSLNPDYGTKDEFRTLVQSAHEHGIRVLMDFVPNHTSDQHPYFQDAQKHGRASRFWDFYDRQAITGDYTYYFDWTNLPNLNYGNPEVRSMIIEAFSYWVRDFDVDGFRTDAAWAIKLRRPSFWTEWRRALKRIKPDLLLLAEAPGWDPYYYSHGFDAGYDWGKDVGHWAWENVPFDEGAKIPKALDAALTRHGKGYPKGALVFRFINNNDTGPRFLSRYGTDMTRVAAALELTLPGVPLVYTADETGAAYLPYEDKIPLVWEDDYGLLGYYKKLIQIRKDHPSLRSGQWARVRPDPGDGVYAYVRTGGPGDSPVLVLLNFTDAKTLSVPVSGPVATLASGSVEDLLTGKRFRANGAELRVPMETTSARILVGANR